MSSKQCFTCLLQVFSLALAAVSLGLFCTNLRAQETTPKQPLRATTENPSVHSAPSTHAKVPPELCLLGIWSYEATTHGVPAELGEAVQTGHWAVTYNEGAYMTAYLFDKSRVAGQKFLLKVFKQNDKMFVERIDVQDSYNKHFGICRVSEDGETIELAFNNPLDGSTVATPSSFDPKSEPRGFLTIKLKRLTDRPSVEIKDPRLGSQPTSTSQR